MLIHAFHKLLMSGFCSLAFCLLIFSCLRIVFFPRKQLLLELTGKSSFIYVCWGFYSGLLWVSF
uniref:Uncharacterized protein n=1 Tax=Utricularia reniformis TaxID=192314 RepID=A0A1Y0B024_9LAMI|nr:hypothetical protein AEK19_MT0519 [Utricularia reniformis]ART30775.1 hypothetical protein AEK19_MT0519 [Utricularia reniformis]